MKKLAILAVLAMALGLGACSKGTPVTQPGCQQVQTASCGNGGS
jgi:hypothetical protein